MTETFGTRPVRDSLLAAARQLREASTVADAAEAAREAALAIEFHLDSLTRALASRSIEPRLRGRAERVVAELEDALGRLWGAERELRENGESGRLGELAALLQRIAESEIDLVLEEFRSLGALD